MVSGNSPDELPPGWKEHVKVSNGRKIKYYTNEEAGCKFYSKKGVIRFVHTKNACQGTSQSVIEHEQKISFSKSEASPSQVVVEKNKSLEWLPQGWIIESRTRKSGANAGSVYKTYIDPLTGCKFYSKPQVIQYLERVTGNAAPEKQQKEVNGDNSSKQDDPQHCQSMTGNSQISGKEEPGMVKPSMENFCCEVIGDSSSKQVTLGHCAPMKGKSHISGNEENDMGNPSLEEVSRDSSKQDAPQRCESTKGVSHGSGKEENGMCKPSLEMVVDGSNVLDELPPGWIKEIRARKRGTKKDPYYIDPVSGYEFRSKKDALRYLEFGDISRCAMTPKKRDRSDLKLVDNGVSAQTDGKKLGQAQAGRQFSVRQMSEEDCGSSLRTTVTAPEAERSGKIEGDNKSTDARVSNSTVDVVLDMQFRSEEVKRERSWESPQPKTDCSQLEVKVFDDNGTVSNTTTAVLHEQKQPEAERGSNKIPRSNTSAGTKVSPSTVDLSEDLQIGFDISNCDRSADSSQPKTEGSKLDVNVDENGAVSNTATAILHEQKHPDGYVNTKTQIQLKKSKKRNPLSTPARSSKRLSGQEPEIVPNLSLSERALRAAVRKPGQTEAHMSSSLAQNYAANGVPRQFDTQPPNEVVADLSSLHKVASLETEMDTQPRSDVFADFMFSCKVVSLETEMQNNIEKPSQELVQEQAVGQVYERREEENPRSQNSQCWYPFGDTFSDPCYEFAFKTLTGEIPIEDTLAFPGCFQQQIQPSFTQGNTSFGLSEIDTPALFQNDVPLHFDSVQQNISTEQVPPTSTIPPGHINLPSCSSFGSQQPSLEARSKDYETKVNS